MKTSPPLTPIPLGGTPPRMDESHASRSQSWSQSRSQSEGSLIEMLRGVAPGILTRDEPLLQPLDLAAMARETVRHFNTARGIFSHLIQFEGVGECWVLGDREHLRAMMLCLLLNAGEHSSVGRAISVSVWCHCEHAHLSVLDRGAGPAPPENESLFQPFRRLEEREAAGEDVAWWLSLAARIAYTHGGEILVAGTPGLGSEVDVRLSLCRHNP